MDGFIGYVLGSCVAGIFLAGIWFAVTHMDMHFRIRVYEEVIKRQKPGIPKLYFIKNSVLGGSLAVFLVFMVHGKVEYITPYDGHIFAFVTGFSFVWSILFWRFVGTTHRGKDRLDNIEKAVKTLRDNGEMEE